MEAAHGSGCPGRVTDKRKGSSGVDSRALVISAPVGSSLLFLLPTRPTAGERERASLSGRPEDRVLLTIDARCFSLVNGKICMHISTFPRSQDSLLQSSISNVKM